MNTHRLPPLRRRLTPWRYIKHLAKLHPIDILIDRRAWRVGPRIVRLVEVTFDQEDWLNTHTRSYRSSI